MKTWWMGLVLVAAGLASCGGADSSQQNADTTPVPGEATYRIVLPGLKSDKPAPPPPTPTPSPTPPPTPAPVNEPVGFPLDPDAATGIVTGAVGSRTIAWGEGPTVLEVSRDLHPSNNAVEANAAGWNCRLHVEYEGLPAVDWYVPVGTPVYATFDGTATLYMNTTSNAFDYFGRDREPYIGDPDRANAPLSPFPGPGGGQGAFVRVENSAFRVDFGHVEITQTAADAVPASAWFAGYGPGTDYYGMFAVPRSYLVADGLARWQVQAGDLIGSTGDAGYSEAPHLHYAITRKSDGARLCPTGEAGFADAGWVWR